MRPSATSSLVALSARWSPSPEIRAAASVEQERIQRELDALAQRQEDLECELREVREAASQLQHEREALRRLAAPVERERPRLRALPARDVPPERVVLRGAKIREVAVRLLADSATPSGPVHYRAWFELFQAHGYTAGGRDPLATFLTQIRRSPLVESTTSTGVYSVNLDFAEDARTQLKRLREELARLDSAPPVPEIGVVAERRQRRLSLGGEIQTLERQLQEALITLAR